MFCMGDHEQDTYPDDSTAKKIQNYIFKYQDLLGKGNFGSAYCGYDVNTGKQVAIKVIKMSSIKSKVSEKLLQNEISILRSMKHHPNILRCCDVFTSVNNCYIITQLCDHDLQKQLQKKGKFKEHQIKELAFGIYKGLEQLSKSSIIHRDIKISNIFLTKNGTPKIADFGFAIKAQNNFKDLNIGSPLYMSPEGLIYNQYGPKTDVWSFGVILYQLINGQTPLERCTTDDQLKTQILMPPRFINPISIELKQLIEACLTVDQNKRPNIFQLINFPYIRKLLNQFQQRPFSFKQSSHISTQCSEDVSFKNKYPHFYKNQINYQGGVSLLHYCRLLHKINKKHIKSPIFSQFLLNFSFSLSKAPISSNNTFNQQLNKLKQVLHEYHNKFLLQYEDMKTHISPRQMLKQIEMLIRNPKNKSLINLIQILDSQTKVLIYSLQHQNLEVFTKNSQSKRLIEDKKLEL